LYFSFVTATSVGFGDVVPVGLARVLAVTESAVTLIIFGCLVSKFVSRRQELLIEEIHRITFEERLGRVRTNLDPVGTELAAVARACSEGRAPRERLMPRIESTVMVYVGELRTVHDLLYRPQDPLDEQVLEGILASVATAFRELSEVLAHAPARPPGLDKGL